MNRAPASSTAATSPRRCSPAVVGGALRLLAVAPDAPIAPPVEDMPPGSMPTPGAPDQKSGALREPVTAAVPPSGRDAVARR